MTRRPEPPDPHLAAVAAYARTLRDGGLHPWEAVQRASRALPRPQRGALAPSGRAGGTGRPGAPTARPGMPPPTVTRRYLVAPRGPDTGTLALHDLNPGASR